MRLYGLLFALGSALVCGFGGLALWLGLTGVEAPMSVATVLGVYQSLSHEAFGWVFAGLSAAGVALPVWSADAVVAAMAALSSLAGLMMVRSANAISLSSGLSPVLHLDWRAFREVYPHRDH